MRVAVIDDENIFRMQLKMMVEKLAKIKAVHILVDEFSGGQEFIDALSEKRYDIVFMDIYMPGMDGIETAKTLRRRTERTFLIFLTASDGHYPDAFSLHAFDYVTKPFTMERIDQVLTEILEHTPLDTAFIKISNAGKDERVKLKNIVSVTTDGHYLEIKKDDGVIKRARLTSGEFLEMTGSDKRFVIINRGIIVNMDYLNLIEGTEAYMSDGSTYPVSTRKLPELLQVVEEYKYNNQ
ncbi:MAG: response regulator transcription factor [Pseudobutyrivibrio ruminis]|uniref:Stage 0 sporulation protein A homolog n=1 Tax=Pseudobutyrivibrio ruminis TaxID=46206 RepID=A0A927YMX8_9FIRM|nr:LytTR family DNA-binding domain-containing protein [Pseudobutyrivibrio sp.]MBE5920294.1 response regulator transcription factor [Pseudobutyrivibrio ruminis]MBQ6463363.1 response regulator transcription factor [Pseudobutyrivibrio sp.]